jgi:hypothetical protein
LKSGRIEGVAPHPTITGRFFVAGQNGGVWQTNDGGTTWTPLTDTQPSLEFNGSHNLLFSPANADIIIGAVGSPRGGMLISQDGGTTWQHQPIMGAGDDPQGIVFDPTHHQTLYCANYGSGFYKSTNLGTSWTQLNLPAGYYADVLMMPSGTLYTVLLDAADPSKNGIHYSVDGGTHWKQSTSSALPSGAALGGGSGGRLAGGTHHYLTFVGKAEYVYASFLTVDASGATNAKLRFVTDDGGAQWTALAASPGGFEGRTWHHTIGVAPESPNVVVANDVANNSYALFISFDYGQTWTTVGPGWDWVNLAFGNDGNVYATADQGVMSIDLQTQQYASMVGDLAVTQFYTVALDASNPNNVYGVAQDISTVCTSGSTTWTPLSGGEAGKILVDFTNSLNLYAYNTTFAQIPGCTGTPLVIRSTDQGQTWSKILDAANAGAATAALIPQGKNLYTSTQRSFEMDPTNAKRLVVGISQVFVTEDATVANPVWSALGGVLSTYPSGSVSWIQSIAIAPSNTAVIYAATDDGHVWVWNGTGATSWTEIDTNIYRGSNVVTVGDMRVDPANATHVFAVTGGGGNNVWELVSGTWQNRSGNFPTDIGINCIYVDWTIDQTPTLIVGTERGVYASTNNGANWSQFMQGFPNTAVQDLQALEHLVFQGMRLHEQILLTAVTYGRGAWAILVPTGLVSGV